MQPNQNSWPEARTPDQPEQRKTLDGSSAAFIISEEEQEVETPTISAGGLRRTCVHLGDVDRAAIQQIKDQLEIPSGALAVRLSIRELARRLAQPSILADQPEPDASSHHTTNE